MVDATGGWGKPMPKKSSNKPANPTTLTKKSSEPENSKIQELPQKTVLEPIPIIARSREGIYLVDDFAKDYQGDKGRIICPEGNISMFNSDGSILAFCNAKEVGCYLFNQNKRIAFELGNVLAMHFSTGEKYLVTIDKRDKDKHYITVFEAATLKRVNEFETMKYKKEQWPHLKFTENDQLAFRSLKPTLIEVLNPEKEFEVCKTFETKSFDFFGISTNNDNILIACISLEHSAGYEKNEGKIDIFEYNNPEKLIVSKVIDKAHEVNLFFSPTGQHLLIWAQTFTDKTGQSYYGEHVVFYLDTTKKVLKRVPTYRGPIHDVAWNPNGKDFVIISGFMPAGSVLYDNQCVPKFEFGRHHRNTIRWNPFSKLICIAGFGNLSGEMEIWDAVNLKKFATFKSNSAVSCLWSPDGRRIMTGVLNPRLRVDNNYKVFKYNGEVINTVDYSNTELYEVLWRPGKYEDRPITPPNKNEKKEDDKEKKVFRPKGSGAFAAMLKAERGETSEGRFLNPDEIFGNEANLESEEPQDDQPKKKKRNRKKKEKKEDDHDDQ